MPEAHRARSGLRPRQLGLGNGGAGRLLTARRLYGPSQEITASRWLFVATGGGARGSSNQKQLPSPTELSTPTRPRWLSHMRFTVARPRPIPGCVLFGARKKGSKIDK